jgi:putative tricarboxylic transport membrane protein
MKNPRDVIIGLALIGFSVLIYAMTLGLPVQSSAGGLNPASFPRSLAIVITALSLVLVLRGVMRGTKEKQPPLRGPLFGQMALFFGIMLIYVLLMPRIGYIVSTLIFLALSFVLIMPRRSARDIAVGLGFVVASTLAVYYIFGIFLGVPLIEGPVDRFLHHHVFAHLRAGSW